MPVWAINAVFNFPRVNTMKNGRVVFGNLIRVLVVVAISFAAMSASADTLEVTESGVWGTDAPTTLWSAPGESWSYSFLTSSTSLASDIVLTDYGIHFQRVFSDFTYTLNGATVSTLPSSVTWYGSAWAGLLNVNFPDSPGTQVSEISFEPEGDQVFTDNLTIIPGIYSISGPYSGVFIGDTLLPLTGTVTIATVTPEPSSFLLLGSGLAALGGMIRRKLLA